MIFGNRYFDNIDNLENKYIFLDYLNIYFYKN